MPHNESTKRINLEKRLAKLEEISNRIQDPNVGIDDALALYKEGVKLSKECREAITSIETEVKELSKDDIRKQVHNNNQNNNRNNSHSHNNQNGF